MKLYHGSQYIVQKPIKSAGKRYNDYGQGFYCTENLELAKEWACQIKNDGYANCYEMNLEELHVLHLTKGKYNILHWLAILLQNRSFDITTSLGKGAKEYILERFLPDTSDVDVIIGYRADDSYFSFAEDFINNLISLRDLNEAMQLGNLGEQIVLLSEKAFSQIKYLGCEIADYQKYYFKRQERDQKERADYRNRKKNLNLLKDDLFILDIIREDMTDEEPRLQSHLSR